jgi:FkbM family methyltransferase
MKGQVKELVQKSLNQMGLQIRRVDQGVSYVDPYAEQVRLLAKQSVKTVFEVGSADGRDCLHYTELFPEATVHAFEPVPLSFEKLQAKAFTSQGRVIPCNVAMSNEVGIATFNIAEWPDASSLLPANQTGSTFDAYNAPKSSIQVNTETIDHYCKTTGIEMIDLLKMDAQGAELSILQGAAQTLQQGRIKLIYAEVNFLEIYQGAGLYHALAAYLETKGFQLHNLYGLATNQKGQLAWGDAIFIRSDLMP